MTDAIKGKTIAEVRDLFTRFQAMVTLPLDQEIDSERMGKLAALGWRADVPGADQVRQPRVAHAQSGAGSIPGAGAYRIVDGLTD